MTTESAGYDVERPLGEEVLDGGADRPDDVTAEPAVAEENRPRGHLPWLGDLQNPRLVPMAVVNDGGYLVPLWTASDLLRGCKYFWHGTRE